MKRFNVTVNGKAYDVAVEEITDGSAQAAPVQPTAAPAPKKSETPAASVGVGEKVNAPMPGTILDVKVTAGETVSKGQVIMILEAMKMENDIVAPCDGKITGISVKKGDTVNSGDTLATIQ